MKQKACDPAIGLTNRRARTDLARTKLALEFLINHGSRLDATANHPKRDADRHMARRTGEFGTIQF